MRPRRHALRAAGRCGTNSRRKQMTGDMREGAVRVLDNEGDDLAWNTRGVLLGHQAGERPGSRQRLEVMRILEEGELVVLRTVHGCQASHGLEPMLGGE